MECDSMHASIERKLRNRKIHVPSDYLEIFRNARQNPEPYSVEYLQHTFFKDYTNPSVYQSIRPGNKTGDPTVTNIRALRYEPDGTIYYKTDFAAQYAPLPRPRRSKLPTEGLVVCPPLYTETVPIKSEKFVHLQELKRVLPFDQHYFYDSLKHICSGHCNHITK